LRIFKTKKEATAQIETLKNDAVQWVEDWNNNLVHGAYRNEENI